MDKKRQLIIEKIADEVRDECNVTGYGFKNIFEAAGKMGYRVIMKIYLKWVLRGYLKNIRKTINIYLIWVNFMQ
jgi:hypothetical protein